MAKENLILVGASVRALAGSALRAGYEPWCLDLFGDVDLRRRCFTRTLDLSDYPQKIPALLSEAPDLPWMFTGGLENNPSLIQKVRQRHWGNSAATLERIRNPFLLAE